MKDLYKLYDLYMRYNGPPPRQVPHTTSPACWEMLISGYLRAIRLNRHHNNWDALPDLTVQVAYIHAQLKQI